MKQSHIRGILNTFKMPTQSITKTMKEAQEQSGNPLYSLNSLEFPNFLAEYISLTLCFVTEWEAGNIEDLTDLLAEDWVKLVTTREMGEQTAKFFRTEMENTGGTKHLAVFDEEEAHHWVLGVGIFVTLV